MCYLLSKVMPFQKMCYCRLLLLLECTMLWMFRAVQSENTCIDIDIPFSQNLEIHYEHLLVNIPNTYWRNCLHQCARRAGTCVVVSYDRKTRVCQLGTSFDLKVIEESPFLSVSMTNMTEKKIPCSHVTCNFNEACVPLSSGKTKCIVTGCLDKPTLVHGTHFGDGYQTNAKISFKCEPGYHLKGEDPVGTCGTDGKWGPTKFFCANDKCPVELGYTKEGLVCYKIYQYEGLEYYNLQQRACFNDGAKLANVFEKGKQSFYQQKLSLYDTSSCYIVEGKGYKNDPGYINLLYERFPYNATTNANKFCMEINESGEIMPRQCHNNKQCGHICEVPLD